MSPKIGFGTLAGYRFVPLLSTEYQSILEVQRIRRIDIMYIILFTMLCTIIFIILARLDILSWGYRSLR